MLNQRNLNLKIKKMVDKIQVHYVKEDLLIGSWGSKVITSTDEGNSWQKLIDIAQNPVDFILMNIPILSRLTRKGVHNIIPFSKEDHLVVSNKRFIILSPDGKKKKIPYQGCGKRPLRDGILVIGNRIVYGEYCSNRKRRPISLKEAGTSGTRDLYSFHKQKIRHIHAIQYDPFERSYWFATGDLDKECMIGVFEEDFKNISIIGSGSQKWRTLSFAFTKNAVYWGTDNPNGDNYVVRYSRTSKRTERLFELDGPIYYCKKIDDYLVFGTSVEDKELTDNIGSLVIYDLNSGNYHIEFQQQKDILPHKIFGYGVFEFASGDQKENQFWVTAKGFIDGKKSYLFQITYG